ncbi:hypothetical protein [Caballeronia zhejiangensis]|uniref:hypothetical protein n=1 Tax=Caballeronia zhejiangensis TaxID=871203 RepID=UPI00158EF5CF|nr:hypothetical protein [Caballeronia zhejiangensis]MCG7403038.1 hypothetical protein [Caballeronia zhejiangensis]MCI1043862.1 hypothetical protein [Caballeronia zhejiangensis]
MAVRHDAIRHHLAHDNSRLRAALMLIGELCEGTTDAQTVKHIARIARVALVSAAPENEALRNPAQPTKGEPA